MENYSYCEELKNEYKIEELDNRTLTYRIDGFINACEMNLEGSIGHKEISPMKIAYINKKIGEEELKYNVNFAYRYSVLKGNNFIFCGQYNDLDFSLINYFDSIRNKDKIYEVPFSITLTKPFDGYTYTIRMENVVNRIVVFELIKSKEGESLVQQIVFENNIRDFTRVLSIVSSFVKNPKVVFDTYAYAVKKKVVKLSNEEVDRVIKAENSEKKRIKR